MAEEGVMPTDFKELIRYTRADEVRIYNVRVMAPGLELWRVTHTADGEKTTSIKEADLTSTEETLELLEDIRRSLQAAGWRVLE
jgi:hypothetical protein